jgi:hypothetical protein
MTFKRLVLVVAAVLLLADYRFGSGRFVQSLSEQAVEIGYGLNNTFSRIVRRFSP